MLHFADHHWLMYKSGHWSGSRVQASSSVIVLSLDTCVLDYGGHMHVENPSRLNDQTNKQHKLGCSFPVAVVSCTRLLYL